MKKIFKTIYKMIEGFCDKLGKDHVSAYAAQSAFFIIISAFPLILLVFSIIQYTPVTESFLLEASENVLPNTIKPIAQSLIREMYESASGTVISITAILTIWSASKGVLALIQGLNNIFHIEEKRNYFILRFKASIYTVLFVVGIVLSLALMVFGNSLLGVFEEHIPLLYDVVEWIISSRVIYIPTILTLLFVGLYKFIDDKKYSIMGLLPGAFVSAVGWMGYSYFYSLYVDNYAGKSYAYGSLTTVVLLMLWIYVCIYILFVGAEINIYFRRSMIFVRNYFRHKRTMRKINKEKEENILEVNKQEKNDLEENK